MGDPTKLANFKYLFKEWYFDIHRYLNGSVTFVGISDHIKVGQNIAMDVRVFGDRKNITRETQLGLATFLLAHVESVSHTFTVNDDGLREFFTTISFVRGVFVDDRKRPVPQGAQTVPDPGLDRLSSETTIDRKLNSDTVFATSGPQDPDPDKRRGQ